MLVPLASSYWATWTCSTGNIDISDRWASSGKDKCLSRYGIIVFERSYSAIVDDDYLFVRGCSHKCKNFDSTATIGLFLPNGNHFYFFRTITIIWYAILKADRIVCASLQYILIVEFWKLVVSSSLSCDIGRFTIYSHRPRLLNKSEPFSVQIEVPAVQVLVHRYVYLNLFKNSTFDLPYFCKTYNKRTFQVEVPNLNVYDSKLV